MTNPQPSVLELAKQGDAKAIAALLNRSLKPKGITAKAGMKNGCLQLFLESLDVPDQSTLMPFVQKGMNNLGSQTIQTVKVYARRVGDELPAWSDEFHLDVLPDFAFESEPEVESETPVAQPVYQPPVVPRPISDRTTAQTSAPTDAGDLLQETLKDVVEGLKAFMLNPVGRLPKLYEELGKARALRVGIVFGSFYVICLLLILSKVFPYFYMYGLPRYSSFQMMILGAAQFVSLAGASGLVRLIFKGSGSANGDIFVAGSTLLAPGFFMLICGSLGWGSPEFVAVLFILTVTYTILTLYTGCSRISHISEGLSPVAIVAILLISSWLSKIIWTAGRS